MLTAGVVRTMLIVDAVGMALLALVYLRQRRMDWSSYCRWGLLALLVPFLGPFLVISNHPGEWDPAFSLVNDFKRLGLLMRRLLPEAPPREKLSRIERLRRRRQQRIGK